MYCMTNSFRKEEKGETISTYYYFFYYYNVL